MVNKNVIEKIQKLLSLCQSSNENEAKTAMLKAQELLLKHKLSMKDIDECISPKKTIKTAISRNGFRKAKWKASLAGVIAEKFRMLFTYNRWKES